METILNNKLTAFALCFFLIFAALVNADEKSHKKSANELLVIMGVEKLPEQSRENMVRLLVARNRKIAEDEDIIKAFYDKYSSWEVIKDDVIKMYTQSFTEQELNELTSFYKSPIGQKALSEIPTLMVKTIGIGQKNMQENLPDLQKEIKKRQEEKKKK